MISAPKKALIIGAGPAGLAVSVLLARQGYAVEVLEKNLYPGGRCGRIVRDGFRFDTGATMMLMPGMYREVFRSLGLDFDTDLPMIRMKNLYTLCFDDGSRLAFSTDTGAMAQQLELMEPGSAARAARYVETGYRMYRLAVSRLLARNFTRWHQFFNLRNVLMLLRLRVFTTHTNFTRRYFRDPHLQMAYTYQNIYVGQNPYTAPALFAMIPSAELTEGSWFPVGGMHALVEKLLAEGEKLGVAVRYRTEVQRIHTQGNRVTGVVLADGTLREADLVVSAADLPHVYNRLLPTSFMKFRLKRMRYSCSAIVFHWGVGKRYPQLDHHTIFLSDTYREGMREIFGRKRVGEDPCFYVHAPVRSDPSAAPEECDALSVIVAVGHHDPSNTAEWQSLTEKVREAVIGKLIRAGLTDLREQIRFEMVFTPPQWEDAVHVARGAVFGSLAHSITQMGWFRPANRHRRYKNLYFTGGSTHPGNGVPMVLMSAKLAAERIASEQPL
ncbi:MAG TPA: phytoene desaturase family protein [Bacteroidales bacterium]|nr:phytoene desaturase family protein [Bacteroidales bacterium]HRZ48082.1 phytoene desaturase family protein [Bacteroidales bacterium]